MLLGQKGIVKSYTRRTKGICEPYDTLGGTENKSSWGDHCQLRRSKGWLYIQSPSRQGQTSSW